MTEKNERIQILEMIESGVITATEGARLLQALDTDDRLEEENNFESVFPASVEDAGMEGGTSPEGDFEGAGTINGEVLENVFEPEIEKWRRWWMIPLWIGVGITIIGSLLMFWAYQSTGFSFWFGCAWLPFLLGVAVMASKNRGNGQERSHLVSRFLYTLQLGLCGLLVVLFPK
jgi:hypothetical protein